MSVPLTEFLEPFGLKAPPVSHLVPAVLCMDEGGFPDDPPQVVLGGDLSDSRLRQLTAGVSLQ